MNWTPTPGDRVRTVITRDHKDEIVYLNADHAIESTISNEFLVITGEWVPWAHQVIDYLSSQRGIDRQSVLKQLLEFEKLHTELDFDELCLLFLSNYELEQQRHFSIGG